ncbi:hypothetical protein ABH944_008528 [Caballeronia udeis]|uniref:Uncharacterized protein n=1 Tax=Caballeronia udeis TaxID=1232866 RepID=A0ABW8MXS7_9BURK
MSFTNPLEPIHDAFIVANDCFKVARRSIVKQQEDLLHRTQFVGATLEEATSALASAAEQASDLAILALFATFERWVIEHLQNAKGLIAAGYPASYSAKLASKFEDAVEWWKIDETLGLFEVEVDAQLIMRAKQIKKYRDWIAHRNPRKPTPPKATPEVAFEVLTDIIEQIQATHTSPAEAEADPAEPN